MPAPDQQNRTVLSALDPAEVLARSTSGYPEPFRSKVQDEGVFVVEGEVTLLTDAGEQVLTEGICAGLPAEVKDGTAF